MTMITADHPATDIMIMMAADGEAVTTGQRALMADHTGMDQALMKETLLPGRDIILSGEAMFPMISAGQTTV